MMRMCHLTDLTRLDTAILQRPRYGVDLDEGEGGEDGEEEDEFMYQEEQEEQVETVDIQTIRRATPILDIFQV